MTGEEARSWALEHAHYTDDLAFWRATAARAGSPVLDLGAAVGRVAIPLARDGAEVWALDRSPEMRAELVRRLDAEPPEVRARVRPVDGDLAALRLGRRFPLVIVAMNTLQVLTEPDDRLACMRGIREHLADDGELVFDVALPDPDEIAGSIGVERDGGRHRDPATGAELRHSGWYDAWDPATHTLEFTLRVVERREGAPPAERLRRHRVHLFTPEELAGLLARAGLEPVEAMGDFDGSPLRPGCERQIHRCRAAAA
ncbi:class I SAM-dependent methyltransferase [Miltoncostaea marina]|uniref:class I SAM-dependent methyltransferase n=1 Tax=Miltoncostaea marina TaxID=2843215 RepID=UPI001C3C1F2E|nr:class I SAM-dependent methyltransferase [Miltoncostaea marina]